MADGIERCVKGKELFWGTGRTMSPRGHGRVCAVGSSCSGARWTSPGADSGHEQQFLTLSLMWRSLPETTLLPAPQESLPF